MLATRPDSAVRATALNSPPTCFAATRSSASRADFTFAAAEADVLECRLHIRQLQPEHLGDARALLC